MITRVRLLWTRRGDALLWTAVVCMLAAAFWRLGNEIPRLLWETDGPGAFDLQLRYREVHRWFAGLSVYDEIERGDYPPGSYAILWPLLGWLPFSAARWLWAVANLLTLGWLAHLCARESTAGTRTQYLFVLILTASMYPASAAIRVGQLINLNLPVLLAGILLLKREQGHWRKDLLGSFLLIVALVKPTISVPFYWIVCFVPGRFRPIVLIATGYVTLTLFAASFQEAGLVELVQRLLAEKSLPLEGHANVHKWLAALGMEAWNLPVSVVALAVLGMWTYRYRHVDVWILLGVAALVARFWMHHRMYDDLLILLPMITLFRLGVSGDTENANDVKASILFALTWVTTHLPAQVLGFPSPWSTVMEAGQTGVWLSVVVFLVARACGDGSMQNVNRLALS